MWLSLGIIAVLYLAGCLLIMTMQRQSVMALMSTHKSLSKDRADFGCRSPVYATFSEALDGAVTIRAFGAQKLFADLNEQQVAALQQASFAGESDRKP